MSKQKVDYNADAKAKARAEGIITIGEIAWNPVKRSGKLMKRIIEEGPDPSESNKPEEEMTREDSIRSLEGVYRQLSILVERVGDDGQKENPDLEFLMEHLDFEDAQNLVEELSPGQAPEDEKSGKDSA